MAQDRDQWQAVVNTVMDLLVPYEGEEFLDYLSDYYLLKEGCAPWS
jgi:hypothetical protein